MDGAGVNECTVDLKFISLLLLSRVINMKYYLYLKARDWGFPVMNVAPRYEIFRGK